MFCVAFCEDVKGHAEHRHVVKRNCNDIVRFASDVFKGHVSHENIVKRNGKSNLRSCCFFRWF